MLVVQYVKCRVIIMLVDSYDDDGSIDDVCYSC